MYVAPGQKKTRISIYCLSVFQLIAAGSSLFFFSTELERPLRVEEIICY